MALSPDMLWLRHFIWMIPASLLGACVLILLLPNSVVSNNKLLRKAKSQLLKGWKRAWFLTKEGPASIFTVWAGKKLGGGHLSSLPKAPTNVKAKSTSCNEVFMWWVPNYPKWNPFHEETYVAQWRLADGGETTTWHTKTFNLGDYEDDGKKKKLCVDSLPMSTRLQFRIAGINKKGKGEWSKISTAITFAQPTGETGGLWGPLGAAVEDFPENRKKYTWTQMRGDINVKIPIPDEWKSAHIKFSKTPCKMSLAIKKPDSDDASEPQVLLAGSFPHRARIDSVFWQIEDTKEDGRHIDITVQKEDPLIQWPCVIDDEDHPKIDIAYVKLLTDGMDDNCKWLKENEGISLHQKGAKGSGR